MRLKTYFLFLLLLIPQLSSAVIEVSSDRNPVHENESFQLFFESDETPDGDPDFSPIQQFFAVLNTSQSNSISIINGDYKRSIKWTLQVMPKQAGDFVIPAIHFGEDSTEPFPVTVKPATQSSTDPGNDLIFEVSADRESVSVQGQVIISMRLMVNNNISAYQFGDLEVESLDVVIEPMGEVQRYQTRLGDQPYLVLEKKLALFPQQSGQLKINPVQGEVRLVPESNSIFDPFQARGEIKSVNSPELILEVSGIDSAFSGQHWLPSTSVRLSDVWQEDLDKLVAGEPVTRTLMLVAEGLTAAQLPALDQDDVDGIKQYPDQPVLDDQRTSRGIVGARQQKVALIPTAGGTYTLPEIVIPWWNVKTQKEEFARVPARTIQVAADPSAKPEPVPESIPESISSEQEVTTAPALEPTVEIFHQRNHFWVWVSLFLACGWLASGILWWFSRRRSVSTVAKRNDQTPSLHSVNKILKAACINNDAKATRNALLSWANAMVLSDSFDNLNSVGHYFGDPLKAEINSLNQSLYGIEQTDWSGEVLWQTCEKITTEVKPVVQVEEDELVALNP